jgi:hypothetical protein
MNVDSRKIEGIFAKYKDFGDSSMFSLIKSKVTETELEQNKPEDLAVKFYKECRDYEKGLLIMPGTPISEMSDTEMPSPSGNGAADNG